jgi:hypothetical protein
MFKPAFLNEQQSGPCLGSHWVGRSQSEGIAKQRFCSGLWPNQFGRNLETSSPLSGLIALSSSTLSSGAAIVSSSLRQTAALIAYS